MNARRSAWRRAFLALAVVTGALIVIVGCGPSGSTGAAGVSSPRAVLTKIAVAYDL